MPELDIGAAAVAGFRVITRNFGAVAIWGVVAFLLGIVPLLFAIPQFTELMQAAQAGPGATPNPAALAGNPFIGLVNLPFALASLVLLQAAIFRCVLAPQQGGLAFIRIGSAELMLAVYLVCYFIAIVLLLTVVGAVFGGIVYGVGRSNAAAGWLIGIPYWIAAIVGLIWLGCRLSLVGPSIVVNGELRLGEAWALTKGRVLALFLTGLLNWVLLFVFAIVLYFVFLIVAVAIIAGFAASMGGTSGDPSELMNRLQHMGPVLIAVGVLVGVLFLGLYILVSAVFQAIAYAPWADAYRQLTRSDAAQTFA